MAMRVLPEVEERHGLDGVDEKLLIHDYAPNGSLANIAFSSKSLRLPPTISLLIITTFSTKFCSSTGKFLNEFDTDILAELVIQFIISTFNHLQSLAATATA